MVDWTLDQRPARIVDAGAGSGRFLAAVLRREPGLEVIAVDRDPLATLMTRAMLAVLEASRARVIQADYTTVTLPGTGGRTAFLGNPPYVRHHQLSAAAKAWARQAAGSIGHRISGLAGLHAYFFLATALLGRPGDVGCFVTSAEWLDVNYGAIMRSLVLGPLGGRSLHVIEPKALPFDGVQTTAVITAFEIGSRDDPVRLQDVESPGQLRDLATAGRPGPAPAAPGVLPLGRPAPARDDRPGGLRRARRAVPGPPGRGHRRERVLGRPPPGRPAGLGAVSVGHQGPGIVRRRTGPGRPGAPAPGRGYPVRAGPARRRRPGQGVPLHRGSETGRGG